MHSGFLSKALKNPDVSHTGRIPFHVCRATHHEDNSSNYGGHILSRRDIIYNSVQYAVLGDLLTESTDGRTIVNALLGAYGLPQLSHTPGFRLYDDFDQDFYFEYPKYWVGRKNSQRQGVYFADFNTADKVVVESFPLSDIPAGLSLAQAAVQRLIKPGREIGGDSKLELPPTDKIKTESRKIDGQEYIEIAFPSETITRSGYQIRRKNIGVISLKEDQVYVLGVSARGDQYTSEKKQTLLHIIESFRVR
jgi:PsbP